MSLERLNKRPWRLTSTLTVKARRTADKPRPYPVGRINWVFGELNWPSGGWCAADNDGNGVGPDRQTVLEAAQDVWDWHLRQSTPYVN